MSLKKTILTLFLLLGILCIIMTGVGKIIHGAYLNHRYQQPMLEISFLLSEYLGVNNGQFPGNQDDLIKKEFLRKSEKKNGLVYEYRLDTSDDLDWRTIYHMEEFTINYGVNMNNLEVRGNKLYDKATGQPVLLFWAVKEWPLTGQYEKFSLELFQLATKKQSEATINSDLDKQ